MKYLQDLSRLSTKIIDDHEFKSMCAKEKGPRKFYELFKVHNDHVFPELTPERPIVSGCGSITENISKFLDHHAKDLVQDMDSYLQNTPDLLRHLEY